MVDFTKRKIDDALPEEQSWPKKSTVVRLFSQRAPPKVLPSGVGSSFQIWQKPSWKDPGVAEASSSAAKPYLQLGNSNSSPAQDDNDHQNIENPTPNQAEKNPINGGGGATSGAAGADDDAAQTDEAQAGQLGSVGSTKPEMDPKKLKRIIANRVSAQKSRMKKNEYMADLENKAKSYQNKIALLHPQIAAYKNHQRSLLIEQHKLKLQMAVREKERILQEAEIEKNKAEVNRLGELQRKQIAEAHARMLNLGAAMQRMSYSNFYPSGLGRFLFSNSDQAQNGVEMSRMQVDHMAPQNQSQMWVAKWDKGQRSIPNLNLVKKEPEI